MKKDKAATRTLIASRPFHLSERVYGRYVIEGDGRVQLDVIIRSSTRAEDLRTAWGAIDSARERLRELQGDKPDNLITSIRLNKAIMHFVEGFSYAEIAMDVNYHCLVHLCRAANAQEAGLTPEVIEALDWASVFLKAMRMKDNVIVDWLAAGLEEIEKGFAPWKVTDGPVDKQRVRDAIRQLRREAESKRLIIKSKPKTVSVPASEIQLDVPAKQKVEELLRREPDAGGLDKLEKAYEAYTERLRRRMKPTVTDRRQGGENSG
jgi:hypothetical protein